MFKAKNISLGLKLLIFLTASAGLFLNLLFARLDGYSSPSSRLLYFTNQSNIWVAAVALMMVIFEIKERKSGKKFNTGTVFGIKLAATVSITLTCVFYCAFLAPRAGADYRPWTAGSILVHAIVPGLAIIDFFLEPTAHRFKKRHNLLSLVPPFYYLVFSAVLYFIGVDFGRGDNFPYFFLNFGSPAGFFGFSDIFPYKMGSFYWIVILTIAVYSTSVLYTFVYNKIHEKKE